MVRGGETQPLRPHVLNSSSQQAKVYFFNFMDDGDATEARGSSVAAPRRRWCLSSLADRRRIC